MHSKHDEHRKEPSRNNIGVENYDSNSYFHDLKQKLLEEYKDHDLEDIEGSEVIETKYGETLKIVQKEKLNFTLKNNDFKKEICNDLTLIHRIGTISEKRLKEQGYCDIYSLLEHDCFSKSAEIAIKKIESKSFHEIFNFIKKNSYHYNNILKCTSLIDHENFKFMDIETLGLSNVPIILIGVAEIKGKSIVSSQYLLRDKSEEPSILEGFYTHLDDDSVYVTYNGASFDLPFIKNRSNFYRMNYEYDIANYDLIYPARRLWRNKLPNCKLTTIEKHLFGIERVDDVPGPHIPGYYETFLKENNIGPLIPIIEHNRMDIVSLASFLMKMCDEII
jgi:uncharacterized protein YprB with RNaseH-like and TPR domain